MNRYGRVSSRYCSDSRRVSCIRWPRFLVAIQVNPFVTIPPNSRIEILAISSPNPKVPLAAMTGFFNWIPTRSVFIISTPSPEKPVLLCRHVSFMNGFTVQPRQAPIPQAIWRSKERNRSQVATLRDRVSNIAVGPQRTLRRDRPNSPYPSQSRDSRRFYVRCNLQFFSIRFNSFQNRTSRNPSKCPVSPVRFLQCKAKEQRDSPSQRGLPPFLTR